MNEINLRADVVGLPYLRVPEITIKYPTPGKAVVHMKFVMAVMLHDGTVEELPNMPVQQPAPFEIREEDMAVARQMYHPGSAEPIPGGLITAQTTMLGILAQIRHYQYQMFPGQLIPPPWGSDGRPPAQPE